jgi:spore coat polysaccharide biosynthesis protein SpsF
LSRHRWTVDTVEDFALIRRIIESLYPRDPEFRMEDVLGLFDRDPGLFQINAHVEQKKTGN